jgi:nucleotide-binding universal stress UspA family protein
MFNKILVPLDGSELAEQSLEAALALAQQHAGAIILVHAINPASVWVRDTRVPARRRPLPSAPSLEHARASGADYLQALRVHELPDGLEIQTRIVEGAAAESIVNIARAENVSLITMSSHGYSGLTRWILGSVAERVLSESPCPVMVLRCPAPIRHILVPLDGSKLSEQALTPAFEIAAALDCKVTLMRASTAVSQREMDDLDHLETSLGRRLQDELQEDAEQYLRSVAAHYPHLKLNLKTIVMHASPAESILDYAQTQGVDLIAMSTHGRTGLQRLRYGSITDKVLHGAKDCSMLVVRPAAPQQKGKGSGNAPI